MIRQQTYEGAKFLCGMDEWMIISIECEKHLLRKLKLFIQLLRNTFWSINFIMYT